MALIRENVCINNVGVLLGGAQVLDTNSILAGEFRFSNGDGASSKCEQSFYCYGQPGVYVFKLDQVIHGGAWKITGTSNLIGSTVHVSTGYNKNDFNSILGNALQYTAIVNEDEKFEFETIENLAAGSICCWIEIPEIENNNVNIATLDFQLIESEIGIKTFLRYKIFNTWNKNICPACNGIGSFKVQTTCAVCNGSGSEPVDNGGTVSCRYCGGVGSHPAGDCAGCEDGQRSNYFISPKCTVNGKCPSLAVADWIKISPYDEEIFNQQEINTRENIEKLIETAICTIELNDELTYNSYFTAPEDDYAKFVIWMNANSLEGDFTVTYSMSEGHTVCLSGDTLITLIDGTQQRLDEIKVGILVASPFGPTKILQLSQGKFQNNIHTKYYFENNIVIDETRAHRFYNIDQGFYQYLNKWNIGDRALDVNNNEIKLLSKETIKENVLCYGIWTANSTYYANGLLSGIASSNKNLLDSATAEQVVSMMSSLRPQQLNSLLGFEGGILP